MADAAVPSGRLPAQWILALALPKKMSQEKRKKTASSVCQPPRRQALFGGRGWLVVDSQAGDACVCPRGGVAHGDQRAKSDRLPLNREPSRPTCARVVNCRAGRTEARRAGEGPIRRHSLKGRDALAAGEPVSHAIADMLSIHPSAGPPGDRGVVAGRPAPRVGRSPAAGHGTCVQPEPAVEGCPQRQDKGKSKTKRTRDRAGVPDRGIDVRAILQTAHQRGSRQPRASGQMRELVDGPRVAATGYGDGGSISSDGRVLARVLDLDDRC
jgi:hypothetical protein